MMVGGCGFVGSLTQPAPESSAVPVGERTVQLLVLQGPEGSALALVPVYIDGQGPFTFALDTGASHSLIDRRLAERLHLSVAGPPVITTGVASRTTSIPVQVAAWSVGQVRLPARTLVMLDLPRASNEAHQLQGLLGSDVLSLFGTILVDYDGQVLTLDPPMIASSR